MRENSRRRPNALPRQPAHQTKQTRRSSPHVNEAVRGGQELFILNLSSSDSIASARWHGTGPSDPTARTVLNGIRHQVSDALLTKPGGFLAVVSASPRPMQAPATPLTPDLQRFDEEDGHCVADSRSAKVPTRPIT